MTSKIDFLQNCSDQELFDEFRPALNVISTYHYNQKICQEIGTNPPSRAVLQFRYIGNNISAQLSGLDTDRRETMKQKIMDEGLRLADEMFDEAKSKGYVAKEDLEHNIRCQAALTR